MLCMIFCCSKIVEFFFVIPSCKNKFNIWIHVWKQYKNLHSKEKTLGRDITTEAYPNPVTYQGFLQSIYRYNITGVLCMIKTSISYISHTYKTSYFC